MSELYIGKQINRLVLPKKHEHSILSLYSTHMNRVISLDEFLFTTSTVWLVFVSHLPVWPIFHKNYWWKGIQMLCWSHFLEHVGKVWDCWKNLMPTRRTAQKDEILTHVFSFEQSNSTNKSDASTLLTNRVLPVPKNVVPDAPLNCRCLRLQPWTFGRSCMLQC